MGGDSPSPSVGEVADSPSVRGQGVRELPGTGDALTCTEAMIP